MGEQMNPAFQAVKRLPERIHEAQIIKLEIPTSFVRSICAVEKAMEQYCPDIVLGVGQAGGRACITVEKVAINLADAAIPDNDGWKPLDQVIREDGGTAYFSTLPVKAMVENMRNHGIPAHISYSAGTYVCNSIMYQVLYLIDKKYPQTRGGFIHVPYESGQTVGKSANTPSMSLDSMVRGLEYAIQAAIKDEELGITQ